MKRQGPINPKCRNYSTCRNLRAPGSSQAEGYCRPCSAAKATAHRKKPKPKAQWAFKASQKVDKTKRYPTSSWWAEAPRETWGETVQAQLDDRMQAGGASGDNV